MTSAEAEALERSAEETQQRVDGHGLVAWLRTLDPKAAPVAADTPIGPAPEAPSQERIAAALAAFGAAALPGLCRAVQRGSQEAARILGDIAAHVPFVGQTLLTLPYQGAGAFLGTSASDDALLACVRAGSVTRAQLVLPPGVHKHGPGEARLARLLARLGAPYVDELLLLVERTVSLTHDRLIHELDTLYRGKVPPELMPVLASVIGGADSEARKDACWLACSCRADAAPLLDALLAAVRSTHREVRRGAASALAYLELPADRALPILEPLLEPLLSAPSFDRIDMAERHVFQSVLDAIAAVRPAPHHLASRIEDALHRALAGEMTGPAPELARVLGRIALDRVVALLEAEPDLASRTGVRLVTALLGVSELPDPLRLTWVVRLLEAGHETAAVAHASTMTADSAPPELVAPLCRMFAKTAPRNVEHFISILARHDRDAVHRELAPLLASTDAGVRDRALQLLAAMPELTP